MKQSFMNCNETYNAEFSLDVLDECMQEMIDNKTIDNDIERKFYLNSLVNQKLMKCNKDFENEFDNDINKIINIIETGEYNVKDLSKFMKRLSRVTVISCNTHITLVKSLLKGSEVK